MAFVGLVGTGLFFGFINFKKPTAGVRVLAAQAEHSFSLVQTVPAGETASFLIDTGGTVSTKKAERQKNQLNLGKSKIEAKITDSSSKERIESVISSQPEKSKNKFLIEAAPKNKFRPGKYTLEIKLESEGKTKEIKQDFTWGVLAINPDKQPYSPNEEAFLAMAVLDDNGKMVCDADVEVSIDKPSGGTDQLSTKNKTILISEH